MVRSPFCCKKNGRLAPSSSTVLPQWLVVKRCGLRVQFPSSYCPARGSTSTDTAGWGHIPTAHLERHPSAAASLLMAESEPHVSSRRLWIMAMAAITSITSSNTSELTDRKVAGFHRRYHGELSVGLTWPSPVFTRTDTSYFAERDFTSDIQGQAQASGKHAQRKRDTITKASIHRKGSRLHNTSARPKTWCWAQQHSAPVKITAARTYSIPR